MKCILSVFFLIIGCSLAGALASSPPNSLDQLLVPGVKALVEQLASKSSITAIKEEEHAALWRRLGKLQLDAREYAEARRIFCRGSTLCPSDEKLQHHVKVWDAFHAPQKEGKGKKDLQPIEKTTTTTTNRIIPPPLEIPADTEEADRFLSLDVPSDVIPEAVKRWKGQIPPNDRCRLIHASKKPILSRQACGFLIDSAVEIVKERGTEWTKNRHIQAPTCDLPAFDLPPDAQMWCRQSMQHALLPLLAKTVAPELDIDPKHLHVQDCFIVRYDGDESTGPGFASLRPHEDESLLSLTIALNDMSEYDGGGLFIQATGDLLNGDAGTVLCFAGQLIHGGFPVTKGTRWILTVFLYVDANESGKMAGYTLDALKEQQSRQQ